MKRARTITSILATLLIGSASCLAQTDPKNVPQPPTAELSKFDKFLGKYEVAGDFANLPWEGTLELKAVIRGWYIQQTILIKSPGIDREFWILTTWDKNRQKYPLWGFQTLPIPPASDGEVRFEGDEMITQWTSTRRDGTASRISNRYRFVSKDELNIWSYVETGKGAKEKIGFLRGKRIVNAESSVQHSAPQPSAEMRKLLNAMTGSWSMSLEYVSTETKPTGGSGTGHVVFRPGPGGLSLIEDEYSKDSTGEQFGLSVTWWDDAAKGFHALWCDNHLTTGCIVMSKLAHWEGDQFVLGDEFKLGGKSYAFKEVVLDITDKRYRQELSQGLLGSELKRIVSIQANKEPGSGADHRTSGSTSQEATLHMPGPDVQNLMLGVWAINTTYAPSARMPNGGTGEGTEIWRSGPGGLSVIEESHEQNPTGELDGFGVAWWDKEAQGQRFVWCENDLPSGCYVSKTVAKWERDSLAWKEEQETGGVKRAYAEVFRGIKSDSFLQELQEGDNLQNLRTTALIRASRTKSEPLPSDATVNDADFRAAMAKRHQAMIDGDEDLVDRLTANEYAQTDIFGRVQDKTAWMAEYFRPLAALIRSGKFRWERYEERDVRVTMFGDTAVVTGELDLKGKGAKFTQGRTEQAPNTTIEGTLRFTRVWIKRDGKWLLAALHNSAPMGVKTSQP